MLSHRLKTLWALAAGLITLGAYCPAGAAEQATTPARRALPLVQQRQAFLAVDDDEKKDDAKAADTSDAQDEAQSKEDKAKQEAEERYRLPEGGVPELLAFLQKNINFRPRSQQEAVQHRLKGFPAMKAAAEKIQELATDEDKKLEGYEDVPGLLLFFRVAENRNASEEEQKKLLDDLKAYLSNTEAPSNFAVMAGRQIASGLEYGPQPEAAVEVYRDLGGILARNKDPKLAKVGEKMQGSARRLTLVGNPLELSGTLMDGTKFDWAKYRGRVVLVDFWATWCGPCRAELPNVKKNYQRYHDKGFEVVGISLDRDRDDLEAFLEKEQNPWVTLHDGDWSDNSVANYYGIVGIPTVFLVDQEGKVVSTKARGPELGNQLEKLLGPPDASEDAEKPAEDDSK